MKRVVANGGAKGSVLVKYQEIANMVDNGANIRVRIICSSISEDFSELIEACIIEVLSICSLFHFKQFRTTVQLTKPLQPLLKYPMSVDEKSALINEFLIENEDSKKFPIGREPCSLDFMSNALHLVMGNPADFKMSRKEMALTMTKYILHLSPEFNQSNFCFFQLNENLAKCESKATQTDMDDFERFTKQSQPSGDIVFVGLPVPSSSSNNKRNRKFLHFL